MTSEDNRLSASLENYLKTILFLSKESREVHAQDIALSLGVSKPSVTGALKHLSEKGLVNYEAYKAITLTPLGRMNAEAVAEKHGVLRDFLVQVLGIEQDEASDAACELEHVMPSVVLDRLLGFLDYVQTCPRGGVKWMAERGFCCDEREAGRCEECVSLQESDYN